MLVDDDGADRGGRAFGAAGSGGKAGHGLQQKILARPVTIGAITAKACRDGVDEARIDRLQLFITEAELCHRAGPEILHHHIGGLDQFLDGGDALRVLQIDSDAALVTASRQMIDAVALDETVGNRPVTLESAFDRLDRDDIRSKVCQRLSSQRAGQEMIEAEDLNAAQKAHRGMPLSDFADFLLSVRRCRRMRQ